MIYDLAILGGGPAGVAAGVYAARKRLSTVFITKDWLGQSYVSEGIENWIGEPKITGLALTHKLEAHLKAYAGDIVHIREGELATTLARTGGAGEAYAIGTSKGSLYSARAVLIATGSSRRKLDIPGASQYDNKGIVYCASCDGPLYADQDVAVIGGGNAAFETAAQLVAYCRSVTMLVRSDYKADPVTVDKVLANPKVKAVRGAIPTAISGGQFVDRITYTDGSGATVVLPVTGVFVEIGSLPNTGFARNAVKLDKYAHIITDARNQRATTTDGAPGVWAAGDCTDGLYHQNNIAAGDAVKALEDIYLHLHSTRTP